MEKATYTPFSKPVYIMAKPAGSLCNLACKYCYYTEKSKLYQHNPKQIMSDELLERFIKDYIGCQATPDIFFTWHGGETMMRPLEFYKKAVFFQKRYGQGRRIENSFQTNGTLITDEWCRFFKEQNWLIGVSIDGPQEFHDEYRKSKRGKPSFTQVMHGINLLNKHQVEWNAMAVVNDYNADYPLDFYHFFKEIGCHYIQFTPVVERIFKHPDGRILATPTEGSEAKLAEFSVTPEQWGDFLCTIFDEWVRNDVGEYFIQIFDATLANWMGVLPGLCSMGETCGHAGVMEFNGDVYSCDHFVFPEYKLGNIYQTRLTDMMFSKRQLKFGEAKRATLTRQCRECNYLFACHGECPKNRFALSSDGEAGQNYLCAGYHKFFEHVAPYMDYMKAQLQKEQAPANIMQWLKEGGLEKEL